MMRKVVFAALVCMMAPSVSAQPVKKPDVCDGLDLSVDAIVAAFDITTEGLERFCDVYRGLHDQVAEAQRDIRELRQLIEAQHDVNKALRAQLPPRGSILLVDDALKCPEGWHDVAEREPAIFAGRAIVAVGNQEDREPRIYRNTGGEEKVKLVAEEMPGHVHGGVYKEVTLPEVHGPDHVLLFPETRDPNNEKQFLTPNSVINSGSDRPHNNMPPYVALYFCKKN